jgi:hypothetical protein
VIASQQCGLLNADQLQPAGKRTDWQKDSGVPPEAWQEAASSI